MGITTPTSPLMEGIRPGPCQRQPHKLTKGAKATKFSASGQETSNASRSGDQTAEGPASGPQRPPIHFVLDCEGVVKVYGTAVIGQWTNGSVADSWF
ncbi:unnamed protein product [Merluccius merluccius]